MSEEESLQKPIFAQETEQPPEDPGPAHKDLKAVLKHLALFVLTFVSVTFVGIMWVGQTAEATSFWDMTGQGAIFATLLLGFLGVHEFGHYFAALHHRVKTTLPYFIPIPIGIGTLGAVIRIKDRVKDSVKLFDIGVAGPLAGFVVSLFLLVYGFATLPDPSFIMLFDGHEPIQQYVQKHGTFPDQPVADTNGELLMVGETLLYSFIAQFFENVPPMWEMYHYPFLFAGWLGLFFTALNLTPIGQLDGGHILYGLIGYKKHRIVARVFFCVLTILAGVGAVPLLHTSLGGYDNAYATLSWLLWAAVLLVLLRKAFNNEHRWIAPVLVISLGSSTLLLYNFYGGVDTAGSLMWVVWSFFLAYLVGLEHPPALVERPLDRRRTILGWGSMVIFVLCISPNPLYFI